MKGVTMEGTIFDIQRFCLQDGPGIRSTVFFKGCNMHCKWCHNPESIKMTPQLMFQDTKCTLCKECRLVCPNHVHSFHHATHIIDWDRCISCGKCVEVCDFKALSICGRRVSVKEVMDELDKDRIYYEQSQGGITFSGGEASLQFDFLMELLFQCKKRSYHTAIETNGMIPPNRLKKLIEVTDLFLVDYKMEELDLFDWTKGDFTTIERTLSILNDASAHIIMRCPIIPGVNDTKEHFLKINERKRKYPSIIETELMAYHDIGKAKWKQCGMKYELSEVKTVSNQTKNEWLNQLNN